MSRPPGGRLLMTAAALTHPDTGVAILLSTYNGASFLQAQLNSFLAQTHENWVLHWRDDGSTDETVQIMRDFTAKAGPGRCVQSASSGPHMGAARSFLALLSETLDAEMVAFADQDDVWLPEKLDCALSMLAQVGEAPALYCARQYLVDEALGGAKLSLLHQRHIGFPACLTHNVANGNTTVMNAAAAALVATAGYPEGSVHDWWAYIVVSACGGTVLFDERPQILYRLHKHNLIGRDQSTIERALAAFKRGPMVLLTLMRRHTDLLEAQAGRLSPQARQDLRLVIAGLQGGLGDKIRALRCPRLRRRTWLENLLFFWWYATNRVAPGPAPQTAPNTAWSVTEAKVRPGKLV